ncbi:hypothetical protein M422DRAFT_250694 [Sphaerobolus stellatus SS14]|uniref:Uncharacterized protein n=1 Tax=Sphaerobolus stellatus (strain SS14) TaxID=990650 RepID=A0A0C9USV6_SPHS4|nr:hypothetical protein M422DRAFT_250694 [Sphaerobolus stellatus SS14]
MFGNDPQSQLHALGNLIKLIIYLMLAPYFVLYLTIAVVVNVESSSRTRPWLQAIIERIAVDDTDFPISIRTHAEVYQPKWMVHVHYHLRDKHEFMPIVWDGSLQYEYTALSYYTESVATLLRRAGETIPDALIYGFQGQGYGKQDFKKISDKMLRLYAEARFALDPRDYTEYVWIDRFIFNSEDGKYELSLLGDIFNAAERVVVVHGHDSCSLCRRLSELSV